MTARAALAREDLPIEARRLALVSLAGESGVAQAEALVQATKIQVFDPARTAEAIAPLLLELPNDAVLAISSDLDAMLGSETAGLRSAAVALKVRSGAALDALAQRDPEALLAAVASLSPEQAPETIANNLLDLVESGQVDAGQAITQADRLSSDKQALFERLAKLADPALQKTFDQWGQEHRLGMAALAGMHQTSDENWPAGYDDYRLERADADVLELGHEKYFHEEKGCVKCHGEHGEGTAGFPALAYSPMVNGDPVRAATIVKYGLMGELAHSINPADGKPFSAQMEPLSYYSDAEMAAALTYVRQHFGNFASPVTLKHMQAAKGPKADKGEGENMWISTALLAKFPFERDRLTGSLPGPSISIDKWTPPAAGLWLMLAAVSLCMALILVVTYAGKFMQPLSPAH